MKRLKGGQIVCVVSVITALGFLSSSSYSSAAAVTAVSLPATVAAAVVVTTTVDVANPLKKQTRQSNDCRVCIFIN